MAMAAPNLVKIVDSTGKTACYVNPSQILFLQAEAGDNAGIIFAGGTAGASGTVVTEDFPA
jgi:hypothetical protein